MKSMEGAFIILSYFHQDKNRILQSLFNKIINNNELIGNSNSITNL